jgi:hypothetical protein
MRAPRSHCELRQPEQEPFFEELYLPRTVKPGNGHDLLGIEIAIGIVVEVPLSVHMKSNNPGPYSVSTIHNSSVRPLDPDFDPDPDPDPEKNLRYN